MMLFCIAALFGMLSLLNPVLAAPTYVGPKVSGCPISDAKLNLTGTTLSVPSGTPIFIALGVGVQNYTCGATGTFASAGAVAKLFDISCLVKSEPLFANVQNMVFDVASTATGADLVDKIESVIKSCPVFLGDHYFIKNPSVNGTGITPVFDFRAGAKKGDSTAFTALKKVASSPSPTGSANVDWLDLQNIGSAIGGSLATTVMRVDTKSGQPPKSCTAGATVSVPYTAKYWMYN